MAIGNPIQKTSLKYHQNYFSYYTTKNCDFQVKFHPEDSNKLISGSTDGLINVFDLSQTSEDDALVETFNTESSIDKLVWYKQHRFDAIACITHVHDLLLWNTEDSDAYARFTREDFTYAMQVIWSYKIPCIFSYGSLFFHDLLFLSIDVF